MTAAEHHDINRKLRILNHAKESGNVSRTCRYFWHLARNFLPLEARLRENR